MLKFAVVTFILPDNRVLLQRMRMSPSSATQWRATAEYFLEEGQVVRSTVDKKLLEDYGFDFSNRTPDQPRYITTLVPTIRVDGREIYSYVIRLYTMWKFKVSRETEFHAKPLVELLDDIYQNSVYITRMNVEKSKHTFNTVQVISKLDSLEVLQNGNINF